MTVSAFAIPGAAGGPSASDDCAGAELIEAGTYDFDTSAATDDDLAAPDGCPFIGSEVWYAFEAPCDVSVTLSTCGSAFDTIIGVYEGTCPDDGSDSLACNDDTDCNGDGLLDLQSGLTFDAVGGEFYYIRIGGFFGANGAGTLTLMLEGDEVVNDTCDEALTADPGDTEFDTNCAGSEFQDPMCPVLSDVWYVYTSPEAGTYDLTFDVSKGFTLAVYVDSCDADDNLVLCGSGDLVRVSESTAFLIQIGTDDGSQGTGTLSIGETLLPDVVGACAVDDTPACLDMLTEAECDDAGGKWLGPDSACPTGRCLFSDAPCEVLTEEACLNLDGFYDGDGTDCTGACFPPDEDCVRLTEAECDAVGGNFQGPGTSCFGACLFDDAPCEFLSDLECADAGGEFLVDESCPTGACKSTFGCIADVTEASCISEPFNGVWLGPGTDCLGACFPPDDGDCMRLTESDCDNLGGQFQGVGTFCFGACSFDDAPCLYISDQECKALGGTFAVGVECPTGACSIKKACIDDVTEEACVDTFGGAWQGADTICPPGGADCDVCELACELPEGTTNGSTVDNTASGQGFTCDPDVTGSIDAWYTFQVDDAGYYVTLDSSAPMLMHLLDGTNCTDLETCSDVCCNYDDTCGKPEGEFSCSTQLSVYAEKGQTGTIWVRVAALGDGTADFALTLSRPGACQFKGKCQEDFSESDCVQAGGVWLGEGSTCPPAGEDCDACQFACGPDEGTGVFVGIITSDNNSSIIGSSCGDDDTIDEWRVFTASVTGSATARLCTDVAASLSVYADCDAGAELACRSTMEGGAPQILQVSWFVTTGESYYVRVAGSGNADAVVYDVFVRESEPVCGDTNSDGVVDVNDLNNIILSWASDGQFDGAQPDPLSGLTRNADINNQANSCEGDGTVDVNDLNRVIVGWTLTGGLPPCPE